MLMNFRWSMLTILVVLSTGLLLAGQASPATQTPAQGHEAMGGAASGPEAHLQMLSEKLNLTDAQKAKLKPILQEQDQQMKAVHDDTSLSPEQKHEKMKTIHEALHQKINGILTPEQQAKFKQMQQEHKGMMKEGQMDHQ